VERARVSRESLYSSGTKAECDSPAGTEKYADVVLTEKGVKNEKKVTGEINSPIADPRTSKVIHGGREKIKQI